MDHRALTDEQAIATAALLGAVFKQSPIFGGIWFCETSRGRAVSWYPSQAEAARDYLDEVTP